MARFKRWMFYAAVAICLLGSAEQPGPAITGAILLACFALQQKLQLIAQRLEAADAVRSVHGTQLAHSIALRAVLRGLPDPAQAVRDAVANPDLFHGVHLDAQERAAFDAAVASLTHRP